MRTISLGKIDLTRLAGYRWEIRPGIVGEGDKAKRHAIVTEVYVVTDAGYTAVPEGQQRNILVLTAIQQDAIDKLFKNKLLEAASREQVDPDTELTVEG